MPEATYRGRRACVLENGDLRVTLLEEGGHVAEIADRRSGINPLWTPPWPSIEPSAYDPAHHPDYGLDAEGKLLAGIMGHNLCLDIFGGPSPEEAAAGLTVHGEAPVARYDVTASNGEVILRAGFPESRLAFERRLRLAGRVVEFVETVENLAGTDRPAAWTQHVTLGPPFLEKGLTQFRATATRSKVFESDFTDGKGDLKVAAEFDWPHAPCNDGTLCDLRLFTSAAVSGAFTTHRMDPTREHACFVAFSPRLKLAFGYVWRQADFPWLGIWDENGSREKPPWSGRTLVRGMEFGASPMPETRRRMVERGSLFGTPAFRWIPARSRVTVEYRAALAPAARIPETLGWDGRFD